MLTKDEALKQIRELQEYVEGIESGEWKPKDGDDYFYVRTDGIPEAGTWFEEDQGDRGRLEMGNVFKTKADAEKHKLRLQSMARKIWLPEDGDTYHFPFARSGSWRTGSCTWDDGTYDHNAYLLGRVFRTEEEAQKWITKYSNAWSL